MSRIIFIAFRAQHTEHISGHCTIENPVEGIAQIRAPVKISYEREGVKKNQKKSVAHSHRMHSMRHYHEECRNAFLQFYTTHEVPSYFFAYTF